MMRLVAVALALGACASGAPAPCAADALARIEAVCLAEQSAIIQTGGCDQYAHAADCSALAPARADCDARRQGWVSCR